MKKMAFAVVLAVMAFASNAFAVEPKLVDGTSWDVGAMEDATGVATAPHPTPWVFKKDGTVSAQGFWTGTWKARPGSDTTVDLTIKDTKSGATNTFQVTFVTSKWFVATKGDQLYRLGKKK